MRFYNKLNSEEQRKFDKWLTSKRTNHNSRAPPNQDNWETFNSKVLQNMRIPLSSKEMKQHASGNVKALKSMLNHRMSTDHEGLKPSLPTQGRKPDTGVAANQSDIKMCGDQMVKDRSKLVNDVTRSNVPYTAYKLLMHENRRKDKYISSISHRVRYLESLLLVKEERINYLMKRLATLSQTPLPLPP